MGGRPSYVHDEPEVVPYIGDIGGWIGDHSWRLRVGWICQLRYWRPEQSYRRGKSINHQEIISIFRLTPQYFPSKGIPFTLQFLLNTMPVNLFPLTWLLPSGNLFLQAEFQAEIFDYKNNIEYPIADIPDAVRVYPASAGTAMLPLTPGNNWTATLVFCGGTNLNKDQWTTTWNIAQYAAVTSCVKISPDVDLTWYQEDALDSGRSMGNVS